MVPAAPREKPSGRKTLPAASRWQEDPAGRKPAGAPSVTAGWCPPAAPGADLAAVALARGVQPARVRLLPRALLRALRVLLALLLALLEVGLDLARLLLALVGRRADELGRRLAPAEPEGQGEAQAERAHEGGVGDGHDLGGDLELVEDHEHGDGHHEHGHDRAHDLARGGVAHGPGHQRAHRRGDEAGHDEDEQRRHDLGQVGVDRRQEHGQGGHARGRDGDGDGREEHEPEADRPDEPGRARAGRDLLDVLAGGPGVQGLVEAHLLEHLREDALDHLGHDVADQQDDQEADELRQELHDRGQPVGEAGRDGGLGEGEHVVDPFVGVTEPAA